MVPVSIGIPAYNAGETIERALASCMEQTIGAPQVVLVDNNCTDDTVPKAQAWSARHGLELVVVPGHEQGCGAARNAAVPRLQRPYVVWLDADDRLTPWALERHLEVLLQVDENEPAISFGDVIAEDPSRNFARLLTLWPTPEPIVQSVLGKRWIAPAGYMLNRAALVRLHETGGFLNIRAQDSEYWVRSLVLGFSQFRVDEITCRYRVGRPGQITSGRKNRDWAADLQTALAHLRSVADCEGRNLSTRTLCVLNPSIWQALVLREHRFSKSGEVHWTDSRGGALRRSFDALDRAILVVSRDLEFVSLASITAKVRDTMPTAAADPLRILQAARQLWDAGLYDPESLF